MVIWLTGLPGIGTEKRLLAEALKKNISSEKRPFGAWRKVQVLDAADVRRWVHPSFSPPEEEQVETVAWIAHMLAANSVNVIVCCAAPFREQREVIRKRSRDAGILFFEVWVDNGAQEELMSLAGYEPPNVPDASASIRKNSTWEELAGAVIFELDL